VYLGAPYAFNDISITCKKKCKGIVSAKGRLEETAKGNGLKASME
jgi:hypothetical protein